MIMRTFTTPLLAVFLATPMLFLVSCAPMETAAGPAPLDAKQAKLLDKELSGKVAGKPLNCLSNSQTSNVIRVSDDMLLYRQSGRLVYQNKLRYTCHGLSRDDDIIVTETFGGSLCKGDLIRLVDRSSGIQGPVCSLGEFVPYRKAAS
jgi:hypothetical protein